MEGFPFEGSARMELETSLATYLRTGSWRGRTEDNAIVFESGVAYARFDSTNVVPAADANGGAYLRYFWRGLIVGWERVYNDADGREKVRQAQSSQVGRFRVK
jgi:hypothetical protein